MTNDVEQDVAAEAGATRVQMIDLIAAIEMLRKEIKPLEEMRKRAVDELKTYMGLSGLDALEDPERGLVAKMQPRGSAERCNLSRASDATVLAAAHAAGVLRVDMKAVRRLHGNEGETWTDELIRLAMPGDTTYALVIGTEE